LIGLKLNLMFIKNKQNGEKMEKTKENLEIVLKKALRIENINPEFKEACEKALKLLKKEKD
jgi:hypothetical protein